jgi:methionyl-tRNA formyltransferase
MRLEGIVLLAAETARSQAYVQALVSHDLLPERVILLGGARAADATSSESTPRCWQDVLLPDLTEPVAATCERAGIPMSHCAVRDVNAPEAAKVIAATAARVIVYSGYGGQIVAPEVLRLGPKFLHIHSGWLPSYRGSTTVYYALLNRDEPGVTALILDPSIDTGPVVARRHYPRPTRALDIDRVYDSGIRADLLCRVMRHYASTGELPALQEQCDEDAGTFYVIHPVLKHLAILSLPRGAP